MAAIQSSSLITLALNDGPAVSTGPPLGRLVCASFALHCVVVLLIVALSLSGTKMKPLMSQEVTLVSFSPKNDRPGRAPKQKRIIKSKTPQAPARSETPLREALASLPKMSPTATPLPRQSQARPDAPLPDAISKIELPPKTPKFKEVGSLPTGKPTPGHPKTQRDKASTKQLRADVDSLLQKLKVPDMPAPSPQAQRRASAPMRAQKKPSLSEDVKNTLRSLEPMQQTKARPVEVPEQPPVESDAKIPEPVREAKAVEQTPSSTKPSTLIQAADAVPGSSGYLARVQDKISKHWMAPPVDLSGQSLVVVIKFRLHRSGTVSDVVVEQPSGNQYYDLAAERAIRSADPLPAFPGSLSEVYLDTHFTFTVGEQVG